MDLKASSLIFLTLSIFSSIISINAIDITSSLSKHENFKVFNEYLTKTKVAQEINKRAPVTVLALHDNIMASITGRPMDEITKIMNQQVILEFYNVHKLRGMKKKKTVTTLYQTMGTPHVGLQGFLNVVHNGNDVYLGSAEPNAPPPVKVLNTVFDEGNSLSVIHVAGPILSPSIDPRDVQHHQNAPVPSPSAAPKHASAPNHHAPASSALPPSAPTPCGHPSQKHNADAAPPVPPREGPEGSHTPSTTDHGSGVSRVSVGYGVGVATVMAMVLNVIGV